MSEVIPFQNKDGFRTPSWVPHVVSISGIVLMLGLSGWQLQRLEWKRDLMSRAYEAQRQPETLLDLRQTDTSLTALEFRPARVVGEFIPNKEYHLGGRYLNGKQGYSIVAPMVPAGSDASGPVIMVERGWVPIANKAADTRADSAAPTTETTVHGVVRMPPKPNTFTPDNHPEKNFWFWPDLAKFSEDLGRPVAPVLLLQTDAHADPKHLPVVAKEGIPAFMNDHLGYAITWFLLAVGISGMYAHWLKRNGKKA